MLPREVPLGVGGFERAVAVAEVGGAALNEQRVHVLIPDKSTNRGAVECDTLRTIRVLDVHRNDVRHTQTGLELRDRASSFRTSRLGIRDTRRRRRVEIAIKRRIVRHRDIELADRVRRADTECKLDVADKRIVVAIRETVAVVVDSVVHLGRVGIHVCVGIVTVVAVRDVPARSRTAQEAVCRIAVQVSIEIMVPSGLVVGRRVAVVVDSVAHFLSTRVDRRIAVIAVVARFREKAGHVVARRHRERSCVAVDVEVGVPVGHARGIPFRIEIVGEPVTVFVRVVHVADFGRTGVARGIDVVAVGVVRNVTGGSRTGIFRHRRVTVSVGVRVGVERARDTFVSRAVAVVVDLVARLTGTRVDVDVAIVAICVVRHIASRRLADELTHGCVTIAVGIRIGVEPVHQTRLVGDRARVAVVVGPVAHFRRIRIRVDILVVAVGFGEVVVRRRAVHDLDVVAHVVGGTTGLVRDDLGVAVGRIAQECDVAVTDLAVTIIVLAPAVLVAVVAVVATIGAPVRVVDQIVAVVIDPVGAELVFAGIDIFVGVVAIDRFAVPVAVVVGTGSSGNEFDGQIVIRRLAGFREACLASREEERREKEQAHGSSRCAFLTCLITQRIPDVSCTRGGFVQYCSIFVKRS